MGVMGSISQNKDQQEEEKVCHYEWHHSPQNSQVRNLEAVFDSTYPGSHPVLSN